LLFDVGEVFRSIGGFSFSNLDFSYGGGVNIKYQRKPVLSFVYAHGSEGGEFNVNSKVSF